jgi:hypothetical protein
MQMAPAFLPRSGPFFQEMFPAWRHPICAFFLTHVSFEYLTINKLKLSLNAVFHVLGADYTSDFVCDFMCDLLHIAGAIW